MEGNKEEIEGNNGGWGRNMGVWERKVMEGRKESNGGNEGSVTHHGGGEAAVTWRKDKLQVSTASISDIQCLH